jgi:tyrosyl-tRNA synthetase
MRSRLFASWIEKRPRSEWLSKLTFADLIQLGSNFTLQQFLTREAFRQRWERGDAIYLHETFYSIMQGYDAYQLQADVQVGGTDQLFNIVTAARKVMSSLGARPNIAIILGILPGTDGVVKMSKSLGNHIPISSSPEDLFGKTMSIPDQAMPVYCRLVTRWKPAQIEAIECDIHTGKLHPRDAKMKLAHEICATFYGEDEALEAQSAFARLFQQHEIPGVMDEYTRLTGQTVVEVLVGSGLAASRGEARRLIEQHGVRFNGETLSDPTAAFNQSGVLQVGKRKFVRIL